MINKTNFEIYLEEQLKDKKIAERFKKSSEEWDEAVQSDFLSKEPAESQKEDL